MRVAAAGVVCLAMMVANQGWAQSAVPAAAAPTPQQAAMQARLAEALKDYHGPEYVRTEAMIPARDGVLLHTVIFRPKDSETSGPPLPFLMTRTPYGVGEIKPVQIELGKPELASSGYIFVEQDIRGRYESGGQFVMNRPIVEHKSKKDVDETTDTRDSIDWLLKNVPNNNGKVGVLGVSYPGFLAMMAGIDAHPAVKAISPQAPMTNIWLGDDFFHNGAFRETYGFDYVQELEAQKTDGVVSSKEDQFDFFLNHVNFAGAAAAAGMSQLPTAKVFLSQPSYVKFWQDMAVEPHLHKPEVPTLEVGGYWDQEDMWGTQAEYAALRPNEKPNDPQHKVFLVLGPWNHGGWSRGPGDQLGGKFGTVSFGGQKTGATYRAEFEAPFFAYYLKDEPGFSLKDTAAYQTGSNEWKVYSHWPPRESKERNLYLGIGGELSFDKPSGKDGQAFTAYVSDPATPVPYRHRPIQATYAPGSQWYTWLVEDQRFVDGRPDVAVWKTAVLDKDVTVTGDVVADIFASTSGTDSDWVVKLIDVYPEEKSEGDMAGFELMTNMEIFRGRYRTSFEHPEPTPANAVEEYKFGLHAANHVFKKGHRIMVEVQSTWFPLYDRNPQKYVTSIMTAQPADFTKATQKVYSSAAHPSHIILPLAE